IRQGCVFCGSEEDLQVFHDKPVCGSCASQAAARFNGAAGQESGHHTNGSHQMGSQSSPN
ncbi:MAG TPA: hypothetical protein VFH45_10690, partial [Acidimicrobiales bacterium]|nr:hypothetical protein [Acidimicrobiales bacterium]